MALDLASDGVARDDDGAPTAEGRFDAALRGYDRNQVDRYVEELTARVSVLRSAVTAAESTTRASNAEVARLTLELREARGGNPAPAASGLPADPGMDDARRLMALAVS